MVKIRLSRAGTKKKPFYHIIVTDSRKKRDGRFLERLGFFNPLVATNQHVLANDRVDYWLSQGAQMSARVAQLVNHHSKA